MNKKNIVTGFVSVAVLAVVIAIVTTDANESTQVANTKKSPEQLSKASPAGVQTTKSSKTVTSGNKQKASSKTKKAKRKTTKSTSSSASSQNTKTKVTRVRWPGMKYRMVRVVEDEKIEPVTELRTWTRKQKPNYWLPPTSWQTAPRHRNSSPGIC